ncbi:hypothetical protein [Streptomyces griseoloalbus]|uniref:Uncharacterized protein n=1 Tax=Streptomyces griseoloalbus TaxID=67303 RepID=A0A7W8BIY0_9ACTN|nr:hypothetical protein [Streptomyces albaduncus]MBB5123777.1 hypothetical protein [Streptomyces albaduncus]GGW41296.1 hypothetical protein GCM10010340_19150 [Streptomyces albaduncus]
MAPAVLAFACLAVLLGFGSTVEMESFPGPRENLGPVAVYLTVCAALLAARGLTLTGRRSRAGWAAVVVIGSLVAARARTLAPMPHCWSYGSVGRNDDGSHSCVNRGDMLP